MALGINLVAFPQADLRALLGAAVRRHRLPENLGQELVREAANFPEVSADAALAFAIAQRIKPAPIAVEQHAASCWQVRAGPAKARSRPRSPTPPPWPGARWKSPGPIPG